MDYVHRDLEDEIKKYLDVKEILAVVGPRQSGKTTLIRNIFKELKNTNEVSFDNVKQLQLFENDIESFIELNVKGYDYLFIDEVQYATGSGKKLKYIYDKFDTKIFVSGSSSAELSIQSMKYLVGRIFTFTLFPFSFNEFLNSKDHKLAKLYESANYKEQILAELNRHLAEFLIYGGYPRVVLAKNTEEKVKVLENIYNTYLLREIKDILNLADNHKLISLLKALSLQIGDLLNYNELSSLTGLSFSELKKYLHILEETYICKRLSAFHTNKRTEITKAPKRYFFDTGFRNVCIDNFSSERSDKGHLNENVVFSEILKKGIDLKYWRTKSGAEVDFIAGDQIPIEVKSNITTNKLTRSFSSFIDRYHPKHGYFISNEYEGTKTSKDCKVEFVPFVKFFPSIKKIQLL